ncbi:hypothetical protein THMIRHAM_19050 [Thiomicrorhabdus immobilis]|uniref:Calx-beta domain-containing protein n=2 Tax=Thiomicrorhabdus immobilis TaxID=2791037 RepID=A0ABM7MFB1_9GAMM|nr:hypothetical protein THMIRHAM_19050 [Thiomicrorhabdus immobilis]
MKLLNNLSLLSVPIFLALSLAGCGGGGGSDTTTIDPAPTLQSLSVQDTSAVYTATSVVVTVSLSAASEEAISVNYTTVDGTAVAGTDYTATSGVLDFSAGDISKTVTIQLQASRNTDTTKLFHLTLSNPTNATISDDTGVVVLLDNSPDSAMFSNTAAIENWGSEGVFTASATCAACHAGNGLVMDYNGDDVSPFTKWKHSTMANALNDPYFNAVVEEEGHVFPDKKVFIEDTCMRCHAPMAYTHAHQTNTDLVDDPTTLLADGGYPFATAIEDNAAREGVACTSCHQVQPDNLGTIASMSGHYQIKSTSDTGNKTIFGPFQLPTGNNMINQTGYTPQYAAHIAESALCASCHNLYTPSLDLDGNPILIDPNDSNSIAQFPEQTPYWEWLNSDFSDPTKGNKTCQACHMAEPEAGYKTVISTKSPGNATLVERPDFGGKDNLDSFFGVHEFVGGNSYLLTLLKTYMTELGLGTDSGHTAQGFQDKVDATKAFLSTAADVVAMPSLVGTTLTVPVKITNNTGHKLPTSYPSRRMWVHLKITDNNGTTVFESGAVDSNGRIAKDNSTTGFTQSKCLEMLKQPDAASFDSIAEGCYEPHHDTINSADQVAIYEGVLGDVNQDITHVLLHARQYLKDNRIPPKGWTLDGQHTNPADSSIMDDGIVGLASTDTDFAPGKEAAGSDATDTVTYNIDVSAGTAPFNVTVELYYQTIKPSFVLGMHADDVAHGGITGDSYVGRFKEMYEKTPPITETLASQTINNIN